VARHDAWTEEHPLQPRFVALLMEELHQSKSFIKIINIAAPIVSFQHRNPVENDESCAEWAAKVGKLVVSALSALRSQRRFRSHDFRA